MDVDRDISKIYSIDRRIIYSNRTFFDFSQKAFLAKSVFAVICVESRARTNDGKACGYYHVLGWIPDLRDRL